MKMRVIACVVLLAAASARAHDVGREMAEAGRRFIASLDDAAKKKAVFPFDGEERTNWGFVPRARAGLRIADMSDQQRKLAHALLAGGLSERGHRQALTIMALETILRDLEGGNAIRDPGLYYVSIFGEPAAGATWGWRFEGHHLSVNFTIIQGEHVSVTPSFFGSNPATVKAGPKAGERPLAAEEDLARELVRSLTPEQRGKAIIAADAPRDIITGQQRKVDKGVFTPAQGIAFDELDEKQRAQLLKLVNEYASRYRPQIIEQINDRKPFTAGKGMVFAWAGGLEPGQGHYYRIQTPDFLFEYDNTQNNANHVHTVWREFDGDFGEDLLRKHYDEAHDDDHGHDHE